LEIFFKLIRRDSAEIGVQMKREHGSKQAGQSPVDRCARRAWSTARSTVARERSTDWYSSSFCWSWSTDRSTKGQGRPGPVDRQANFLSWTDSDFISDLEMNPIEVF